MIKEAEAKVIRCIVDDLPIESSPAFRVIKAEIGEKEALKWTKTERIHVDLKSGDP